MLIPFMKAAKPSLEQLLLDYEKAKQSALSALLDLEEITSMDFRSKDISFVSPLKPLKLRFIRDSIDASYRINPHSDIVDYLNKAWAALAELSQAHSKYFAYYQSEHKNEHNNK